MPSPIPGPPPLATSSSSGLVSTASQQFSGAKEFLGKIQQTGNPLGLASYTTGGLPAAASHVGGLVYNTTVSKIQFSNGSVWASLDAGVGSFVQTTGDTMTGQLTIVGAGLLVDSADNTLFVDAVNNRVGIGVGTPTTKLDIDGGQRLTGYLNLYTGTANTKIGVFDNGSSLLGIGYQANDFRLHLNSSADKFSFRVSAAGASLMELLGTGDLAVDTDTLYVDSVNNRVGVGTAAPGYPLSVAGVIHSSSGGFRFPDSSVQSTAFVAADYVAAAGDTMTGALAITGAGLTVDTDVLVVDAASNRVGVGTATPSVPLQVVGSTAGILVSGVTSGNTAIEIPSDSRLNLGSVSAYLVQDGGAVRVGGVGTGILLVAESRVVDYRSQGSNILFTQVMADNLLGNSPAVIFNTTSTYTTNKLLVSRNNGVERFSVQYDGTGNFAGGLIVDTNTLFVDAANNRVGIGTLTPSMTLEVNGSAHVGSSLSAQTITSNGDTIVSSNLTVDTNTFKVDATNNRVGIGTASPSLTFEILKTGGGNLTHMKVTDATVDGAVGVHGYVSQTANNAGITSVAGNYGQVDLSGNTGLTVGATGSSGEVYSSSSGTIASAYGVSGYVDMSGAGTITEMAALYAYTNARSSGTVTTNIGLAIDDQTGVGSTNYQIYSKGSDPFVVQSDGKVGIGTDTPTHMLEVVGDSKFGGQNTYHGVAGITAYAGGGQANAVALTGEVNFVDTVATTGDSVKLPTPAIGMRVVVFNLGANQTDVFPPTGVQIDALGTNNAYALNAGASREFWAYSATQWHSR